jgi:hypothetical protein
VPSRPGHPGGPVRDDLGGHGAGPGVGAERDADLGEVDLVEHLGAVDLADAGRELAGVADQAVDQVRDT